MRKKRSKKTLRLDDQLYVQIGCQAIREEVSTNILLEEGMLAVLKAYQRANRAKQARGRERVTRRNVSTTIDPKLYKELRLLAKTLGVTANVLVEDGIVRVLQRRRNEAE